MTDRPNELDKLLFKRHAIQIAIKSFEGFDGFEEDLANARNELAIVEQQIIEEFERERLRESD